MVKKNKTKPKKFSVKSVSKAFKLPIQTGTLVPSTLFDKTISPAAFRKRINETRRMLSQLFGGYTSVNATGGFVAKDKRLIREKVAMVVAYAERAKFRKNKSTWLKWVRAKKKEWKQEAIGIIIENDMFWI